MKSKHHTDAHQIMGKSMPAVDRNMEIWISKTNARVNNGSDTIMIIDFSKNTFYSIHRTAKTYTAVDMNQLADQMKSAMGSNEKEIAQMTAMMQNMMQVKATVKPTGETKKIKNWNCKKFIIDMQIPMGTVHTESWTTKDISVDLASYQQAKNAMFISFPGFNAMIEELKKIDGVQVLSNSVTSTMGNTINGTEELLEISEKSPPAGMYEIPKDYKKVQ
jgi:hypothetical protein